jgi:hypothetical protein
MASSHETKYHIEMKFELSYDKRSKLVGVVVTSDKKMPDQPNKENNAST